MFESEFRNEIFEALKFLYWRTTQHNLPVFGVHDKLKEYSTSKKDISNGIAIMPKENYRLPEEDIYQEITSSSN